MNAPMTSKLFNKRADARSWRCTLDNVTVYPSISEMGVGIGHHNGINDPNFLYVLPDGTRLTKAEKFERYGKYGPYPEK